MIVSYSPGEFNEDFPHIPAFSQTLNYSMGLFEGMSAIIGEKGISLFHPDLNYERLQWGVDFFKLPYKVPVEKSIYTVFKLIKLNNYHTLPKGTRIYVRPLIYVRNTYVGLTPPKEGEIALLHAISPMGKYLPVPEEGIKVWIAPLPRTLPFAKVKASSNYQLSLYARRLLPEGFHEAAFLNAQGKLVEGSGENVVVVKDNTLYTPKEDSLPGITLRLVLMLAEEMGLSWEFKSFTLEEIKQADALFFTGNAAGIVPIGLIEKDGTTYQAKNDFSLVKELQKEYDKLFWGQPEQYHVFMEEFLGENDSFQVPERWEKIKEENISKLGMHSKYSSI
ncbi:MAG: hypothetical protein GXN92_00090 [Candidatus Micrarchaeota archaeon]|nr:hypothetical protein [Candidatus Micrarchaeota archaeon]